MFLIEESYKDFIGELSDIIMCALIIAGLEEINIEQALKNCLKKIRQELKEKEIKNELILC